MAMEHASDAEKRAGIPTVAEDQETASREEARARTRNRFLGLASLLVVTIILSLSLWSGDQFFAADGASSVPSDRGAFGAYWLFAIPYLTCLAGVLLFIMGTARMKGDDWDLTKYWGEHTYRIAQAFAYLFVVWWAWARVPEGGGLEGTYIRPNILGFLVGFFILRVERAMDGLGDKFEEVLFAVLPRAARYTVIEERKRQQVRAGYKLTDISTQWDVLAAQVGNEAAKQDFEERLKRAIDLAGGSDPEKARHAADEVTRYFERLKAEAGEILVSVDELIGR